MTLAFFFLFFCLRTRRESITTPAKASILLPPCTYPTRTIHIPFSPSKKKQHTPQKRQDRTQAYELKSAPPPQTRRSGRFLRSVNLGNEDSEGVMI
ncbi:hypothetical protein M433DRAFT_253483 [Acidomyces richmondensis BFW]|nr:MAG: hypothetical protein FE78DRAFT_398240 [Acidomyces sp. 'richmondensis']KYG45509.1 hypothetical protein M433DRAFT_253483 [Acidomyces richmondensis BFW]